MMLLLMVYNLIPNTKEKDLKKEIQAMNERQPLPLPQNENFQKRNILSVKESITVGEIYNKLSNSGIVELQGKRNMSSKWHR